MKKNYLILAIILCLFSHFAHADFTQIIENIDNSSSSVNLSHNKTNLKIIINDEMVSLKNAKLDNFIKNISNQSLIKNNILLDVVLNKNELENNIINRKKIDKEIKIIAKDFIATQEIFNRGKKQFETEFKTNRKISLIDKLYQTNNVFIGTRTALVKNEKQLLSFSMLFINKSIFNIYIKAKDTPYNRKWVLEKNKWVKEIYKQNKQKTVCNCYLYIGACLLILLIFALIYKVKNKS
jgi:hypothetical protein